MDNEEFATLRASYIAGTASEEESEAFVAECDARMIPLIIEAFEEAVEEYLD